MRIAGNASHSLCQLRPLLVDGQNMVCQEFVIEWLVDIDRVLIHAQKLDELLNLDVIDQSHEWLSEDGGNDQ